MSRLTEATDCTCLFLKTRSYKRGKIETCFGKRSNGKSMMNLRVVKLPANKASKDGRESVPAGRQESQSANTWSSGEYLGQG